MPLLKSNSKNYSYLASDGDSTMALIGTGGDYAKLESEKIPSQGQTATPEFELQRARKVDKPVYHKNWEARYYATR
ncbi:unnamed protein product [Clonostachys byssicola]|uniref:Uncharacterized protein n=1 Tax=Clonostachys byssicola TaxID=160290 RepID=A0A9N9UVV7_9HYPO|nr:unnamed protein product [Clonostachys byssicola]